MNIHHDLPRLKMVAKHLADQASIKYNIIILNPNENGEFDLEYGSTYEFVIDSYFENPRPNVKLICTTDDIKSNGVHISEKCGKFNC